MSKAKKGMPRWLDLTLRVIEWTLIIVIVVCMLILLSQKITGNTPELFGYSTYTIVTDSMKGTYDVGDVVLCKRIKDTLKYQEQTGFKEGDVIAFIAPHGFDKAGKLEGRTITHRIVVAPYYDEATDTWYVHTKGDNAIDQDRVPIPVENIQGIIVGTSKSVSKVVRFITTWYGFLSVVITPLVLILLWQIAVLIKGKTNEKKAELENEKQNALKLIEAENNQKVEDIKKQAIEQYKQALEEKENK